MLWYKFILILLFVGYSSHTISMVTFDAQNFAENVKIYGNQLEQLQVLKQQIEYQALQNKKLLEQNMMQRDNLKKLKFNNLKSMYKNLSNIKDTLNKSSANLDQLQGIDDHYRSLFLQNGVKPLPSAEENAMLRKQLNQSMETNRRAMNALKVLESYEEDKKRTNNVVQQSQNAAGQMQAIQSSNQLAAMQIKELQEMKLLMAESLESRVVAVSEENAAAVIARHKFKTQMAKPIKTGKVVKLPKLN